MRRLPSIALLSLGLAAFVACTNKAGPLGGADASFDIDSGLEFDTGSDATTAEDAPEEAAVADATFEASAEAAPRAPTPR